MSNVNIKPGMGVLAVLQHLNYKPWYALAEFVDNAIDSYLKNKKELKALHGDDYVLKVAIHIAKDTDSITIYDNAAGIDKDNYQRAFRPAEIPPDSSKLSEFGMGMKSAACWFTNTWNVRSTALNEAYEKTVSFDITQIVNDSQEELEIREREVGLTKHFTVVSMENVGSKIPVRRSLSKVKGHLASIYRDFLRKENFILSVNNEDLKYVQPNILSAKRYDQTNEDAESLEWKKDVSFDFGPDLKVVGFVALMETAVRSQSGFALFRRGRVIEGSADNDDGFRPEEIFKQPGSPTYIRLFGELHLTGFEVSHTKDVFQWDDNLEEFLKLLKEELDDDDLPILKQADKYRVRESKQNYEKGAKGASKQLTEVTNRDSFQDDVDKIYENYDNPNEIDKPAYNPTNQSETTKFSINFNGIDWSIWVELSYDPAIGGEDLIDVGDHLLPPDEVNSNRNIGIRLSLIHPFMVSFTGSDKEKINIAQRIVVSLCLSEFAMKQIYEGDTNIAEVRKNMNTLLAGELSKI